MQAVSRLAALVKAVAAKRDGVTLAELARTTHLSSAACTRLMEALESEGFVERDPVTRRFRLGIAVVRLAASLAPVGGFGPAVEAALSDLCGEWHETVFLGLLMDGDVVLVSRSPSEDSVVARPIGHRVPMHASAAGKAILSQLPGEQARLLLERAPLERLTRYTQCDLDQVLQELAETRDRGFAVCNQETDVGVVAYAAPMVSSPGEAPRCLGVIGSRPRILEHLRDGMLDSLMTAAESLSAGPIAVA
jgi:DNA-binding IclR family transcriptional regulator